MYSPKTTHTYRSLSGLLSLLRFRPGFSRPGSLGSLVVLVAVTLFVLAAPRPSALMPAAAAYGWQPVLSVAAKQTGMRMANFLTAGRAFKSAPMAPSLGLIKQLIPAAPTAIPTGRDFTYRLRWQCAGSISPQDDCFNMKITDVLPMNIQFVSAPVLAPVVSVTTMGSNPQTVTLNFQPIITAGSTGEVDVTVRYQPGVTPNGLTSNNVGQISSDVFGGGTVSANSNTVTTTSVAGDNSSSSKTLAFGGVPGALTGYDINVCNDANPPAEGYLALQTVTITDVLAPGVQYISSNPPATTAPPSGTNGTVTWVVPAIAGACQTFRLVVRYPSPPFVAGQAVTNNATVTGTLTDGTPKMFTPGVGHNLAPPAPSGGFSKSGSAADGSPDQIVGGTVNFTLNASNTGNVPVDQTIVDNIPGEMNLTSINTGAAGSVDYQKNGVNTWFSGVALGANVAVNNVNFPGFAGYVSRVRFNFTNVMQGDSNSVGLTGTIVNPPNGGAMYALPVGTPHNFCNTATLTTSYNNVVVDTDNASACLDVVATYPTVYPQATKTTVGGATKNPGELINFQLGIRARTGTNSGNPLLNPVLADLLPANLDYVATTGYSESGATNCASPPAQLPTPQVIANYNGTGRTLLIWSWLGKAPSCSIAPGGTVNVDIQARIRAGTTAGTYQNIAAIIDSDTNPATQLINKRFCGSGSDPYVVGPIAGSGNEVDMNFLCQSDPISYDVRQAFVVDSRKGVKGQLNDDGNPATDDFFYSGTTSVARTIRGGVMFWSHEIINTGNIPATNIDIIDILPFNLPAPGNTGVGTGAVMGSTWQPFFLTGISTAAAPPGTKVYYSTDPNPCRPLIVAVAGCQVMATLADGVPQTAPGQWSTVLPADPTKVKSFRINFGSYVLPGATTFRFEWPMSAPDNAPIATNGPDGIAATVDDTDVAWNTFGYSLTRTDTGDTLASAPTRVGIIVQGTPPGLASYGNYVWEDVNKNGLQDEPLTGPTAKGINGVRVDLYTDADGNPGTPGDQTLFGVKLTANDSLGNPGYYVFPGLQAGNYFVRFYQPTEYNFASPPNVNANANDTTDSDGVLESPGIYKSHITALVLGQDYVDTDQGFYADAVSIGNTVWFDTNNNATIDAGEVGKNGVLVELFRDANGTGALEDGSAAGLPNEFIPVARQLTSGGGFYLFTQTTDAAGVGLGRPIKQGRYFVGISPFNFNATGAPASIGGQAFTGGMLAGYRSSGSVISSAGVITDPTGPNGTTDSNGDNTDDGLSLATPALYANGGVRGVMSGALNMVAADTQPINETTQPGGTTGGATSPNTPNNYPNGHFNTVGGTAGGRVIDDNDSNVTVDFGFYYQCLGNLVFNDNGVGAFTNNAVRDAGELGIAGVSVRLYAQNGTTEINVGPDGILGTADDATGGMLTNASGNYQFCSLPQGQYVVKIVTPPTFFSSDDIASTSLPEGNVDDDDNGVGNGQGTISSVGGANAITMTPGAEPVVDNLTATTINNTFDFAIYPPPVSIGNTVWLDTNNNSVIDAGEVGRDGILVELFLDADNNGSLTGAEQTPIARQLTTNGGFYLFTQTTSLAGVGTGVQLNVGNYVVGISPFNFNATGAPGTINSAAFTGGLLTGYLSSATSINGVGAITDATNPANTDANGDNSDDGVKQGGASFYKIGTVTGVLSGLLNVTPNTEPTNETTQPGNVLGGVTPGRLNTVTGLAGGRNIEDNDNNVTVDFGFYNQVLGNLVFVDDGGPTPANNNNGKRDAGENGLAGVSVSLFSADGVTQLPVGADGILGTADDAVVSITTNASGNYQFGGLPQGQYVVKIVAPTNYRSSNDIATTPTPEGNLDDDDNGVGISATTIASVTGAPAINLTPGSEPVVNNATATTTNTTLDFGLVINAVSIGNTVWFDTNNNSLIDATEVGKDGVLVELFFDANDNGTLDAGVEQTPVARQLTTSGGYYLFVQQTDTAGVGIGTNLLEGRYFVGISPHNFSSGLAGVPASIGGAAFTSGMLAGYQSSNTSISGVGAITDATLPASTDTNADNADDGVKQSGAAFYKIGVVYGALSGALNMAIGGEPANETTQPANVTGGATPGHNNTIDGTPAGLRIPDTSSNVTVDFGFYIQNLGNLVFNDNGGAVLLNGNNAVLDAGELGVNGVPVKLYAADGTTEVPLGPDGVLGTADDTTGATNQVLTNASGNYQFRGLPQGQYIVKITAPPGSTSSDDIASTPNPDNNTDSDDNGLGFMGSVVAANAVTLTPASLGALNNNTVTNATATTTNPTVDFALILTPPFSLGNTVWLDTNNNGVIDAGEIGKDGVLVELFSDTDNDGLLTTVAERTPVARQLTSSGGFYLFTQTTTLAGVGTGAFLGAGLYFVGISPFNFSGGLAGAPATINGVPFVPGMLTGYQSSATTISNAGVVADGTVPANTDGNSDNSDDGNKQNGAATHSFYQVGVVYGVMSGALNLSANAEPLSETTQPGNNLNGATPGHPNTINGLAGGFAIEDDESNLTVDFGFYNQRLGDLVFSDDGAGSVANYDNGLRNAGEGGLLGVTLKLYAANGTTEIPVGPDGILGTADDATGATNVQMTAANGLYQFSGLPQGAYVVEAMIKNGYKSSKDVPSTINPDGNVNDDDNGETEAFGVAFVKSRAITLTPASLGALNNNTVSNATGTTVNPTLDFGEAPRGISIGNTVWNDINNNGVIDAMEKGIDGVRVELFFDADNNGSLAGAELTPVAVQLTGSGGYYLFTQTTNQNGLGTGIPLLQGRYFIGIAAVNFTNGPLYGYLSSGTVAGPGGVPVENAIPGNLTTDSDQDNFDDGLTQSAGFYTGGVLSGPLVVQVTTEPTNETTAGMPGATGGETPGHPNTIDGTPGGAIILDQNSNLTVDFGFYSLRLGNLVWYDKNNNGLRDGGGSEPGIGVVRVALYFDRNNNGVFEPNAGDGAPVQATTTDPNGLYLFVALVPGNYFVYLPATNFDFDRPLFRLLSSTVTQANPNTDIDNDDNGLDDLQPDINGIRTNIVTLTAGGEPDTPVDTDDRGGNLTVDFGFYGRLNLGNLVWKDFNNNGIRENFEPGVDGVSVQLFFDRNNNGVFEPTGADAPVYQQTSTAGGGVYNFINLELGTYWVLLPAGNFQGGGALAGCLSSTTTQTPNTDVDNDDNGLDDANPQTNGIRTDRIDLAFGTEPDYAVDGDDKNGNLTVDLGFYAPMNLGNLVWKDNNNNGVKDATEPGMDGVTVELIRDANSNGQPDDAVVATQVTAGGGLYNFTNLLPGNYFVRVAAVNFMAGGALVGCFSSTPTQPNANSDVDNDDNGIDSATPQTAGIVSGLATLLGNSEPPANIDGDGTNGNLTVDFGFYPPMNLGNLVWKDFNNNGLKDAAEPGMDGVTVELYRDSNSNGSFDAGTDQLVTSQITAGGGLYNFTGLLPGAYLVRIPASNFVAGGPLFGCLSSTTTVANPNSDIDNDDNGIDSAVPQNNGIASNAVTLIGNSEPTTDGDGANGNLTVDFGFYSVLKLGNLVWKDTNNNGTKDAAEPGIDNVRVELYADRNNNGTFEPNGADAPLVAFTITSGGGLYQFTGLLPGNYFVLVAALNFQSGQPLAGCFSSVPTNATPNSDVDNDDNGIDSANPNGNGIASGIVTLAGQAEPDVAVDGDDRNGNQTVDFGFYPPLNLGNLVWKDDNNNGLKDVNEPGVNGVTVELIRDANANNLPDDAVIATTVTLGGGLYNFTGLPVGNYFVRVAAVNFGPNGPLTGCLSSTVTQANPNTDIDNDDNGIDSATPQTTGIASGVITLSVNGEPPANVDGDGTNGNLTIDFGFYPPMNLGNLVWKDFNNNGLRDAGEPGVDGVAVQLIADANNNNLPDDAVIATLTTSGGGLYNFTNLLPGNYFVRVAASNFTPGGALVGCLSSTTTEANPNADVDNNDNGIDNPTPATGGITSGLATLLGFAEPGPQVDGDGPNGNLTVDFGFYAPMNLGNLVWKDLNNNGLKDAGEAGVDGVTVELIRDANGNNLPDDAVAATLVTAGGGLYNFTNLVPGTYFVRVAASNFNGAGALVGCLSSEPTEANPNDDVDNNDDGLNNPTPGTGGVVSGAITLIGNTEPPVAVDGDGPNGNQTVDFGFIPLMNLGNLVWKDYNNNGLKDAAEPGVGGVTVELIRDANNNGLADDAVVATQATSTVAASLGQYNFTGLAPGTYIVRIAASNFTGAGVLAGCLSSTTTEANPNADVDNNDNGVDNPTPANGGVASGAVTLTGHGEPTNDGDSDNGNLTVDFGFYTPLTLGNLVWKDLNNDGLFNNNEPGVNGVTVQLYRETNGTPGFQIAADTLVASTTTGGGGLYTFTGLAPGDYYVYLPPANFAAGGGLAGCASSTVDAPNPNNDVDNDDNGLAGPNGGIVTGVITLSGNTEPTNDGDGPNGNLTVDLGFYPPVNLGNLVWKDLNNNGQKDANEPGVDGVAVELIRDANSNGVPDDAVVATQATAGGGLYNFTGLQPGTYFVRVTAANFNGAGALVGCLSSEPTETNPNLDVDNNDDGLNSATPGVGGIASGAVTLTGHGEPTNDGDGDNGNLTVDFGFIPLLNVGNTVWKDNNNNGLKDAGEPGMNGVTVVLYRDTNGNNQLDPATDQLVATTTTAGAGANAGQYSFTGLVPANYFVYLPSSNFTGAGALAGCLSSTVDAPNPNNDTDNDDNGLTGPNGGIVTGVITLTGHGEPTNDGDGDNGNLTIDLGFYSPLNLGNLVWKDENNDGIHQPAELGIDGVLIELFKDANSNSTFEEVSDTPAGTLTTSGGGLYNFTNLTPGVYFVRVAKTNFQPGGTLAGCLSSSITAGNPDNDVDNDDNGLDTPPSAVGIISNAITLASNSEPTNDGDGANGNLTLDFGFYAPLTLGNLVWKDNNNNGLRDAGEPGIDSVTVELIRDANSNNLPDDAVVATVNTTGGGLYSFTNLQPGNYFVRIAAINFQGANTLAGCVSSTPSNPNPNSDIDNDDNGIDNPNPQTNGIVTGVITLAGNTEPPANVDGDGTSANETVDFGFYAPLNLGNLVWKDNNNNGLRDAGEPGVNGVAIELFRDTNSNGTFEPGTDLSAGAATTAGGGLYSFANLLPGNYFVRVAPINFQAGGALFGCSSSSVTNPTPNSDVDNDDNGIDNPSPQTNGILSGLVTLAGNSEPPVAVDGDGPNGNLTVDFGFITGALSIGNLIWKDTNANGLREASEPGIANVKVELIRDANSNNLPDDATVQTVTTNAQGIYNFTGLAPGNYFVRVAASNFIPGGVLNGCVGTPGNNPPNNDTDNDDNGSDSNNPASNPPISGIITLTQGGEPTNDGDGADSNQTVDFGFITPIAVTITDPAPCIGPGTILQVEVVVLNAGAATQANNTGAEIEINLPAALAAVAGSCTSQGGNGACTITGTQRVTWDGSYGPGERVVVRYKVQVSNTAQPAQQFCITSVANFDADNNGSNESQQSVTVCEAITCQAAGPGQVNPGCSVLIYPVYTSSSTNPNLGNTRINLTNANPNLPTAVHLFFVDGATCSVTDAFICLTANQTTSFLMSDLDPGTTGYLIAVAVDRNGCPSNFNNLLGDEYVKFDSGHHGNLSADCATAIAGGLTACQVGSSTATLNFDGVSYSQLPQTVAADNLSDRASGNDTLLILDRISGNLATGMDKLGGILGLLYNDQEVAFSFSFTPNTCQLRSSLSNAFPRTAPRYEVVIPSGRSGWLKLSSVGTALIGATFNRNPNSVGSANAFNGAHGLHGLTLNPSVSVTMPVFPPSCQ